MFFTLITFIFIILSIDSDENSNIAKKGSRINWGRYPYREKMAKDISYWKNNEGGALDVKGNTLTPKEMFASNFGIP